jgi:hypothetical protein
MFHPNCNCTLKSVSARLPSDRDDYNRVPWLLQGGPDWPVDLQLLSLRQWRHILNDHSPESNSGKSTFALQTDIGEAIFDVITRARPVEKEGLRTYSGIVNGQEVVVRCRWNPRQREWFIASAYPKERR